MLKRLLPLFIFVSIAGFGVRAQGLTFTPSAVDTLALDTTVRSSSEANLSFNVVNNSSDSIFNWTQMYNTFPHSCWEIGFCDPHLCRIPIPSGVFSFKLRPGDTALMQLDVTDTCLSGGCGLVQILTWNPNDSAATATYLNYRACLTISATAGITNIAQSSQISFYPNPVKDQLTVALPQTLDNGQIDIFSILGAKVYSQHIGSNETSKEFDLSTLETGLYIARISDGGRVLATRKFTKED